MRPVALTGTPNIKMHYFPTDKKLRDKWTRFVRMHRKDFVPKKLSCLCFAHFDESCYRKQLVLAEKEVLSSIDTEKKIIPGSIPYVFSLTDRKQRRVSVI